MNTVVVGGTRGIGRAIARGLATRGDRLFLLGRDPAELARSAADLELRGAPAPLGAARFDLLDRETHAPSLAAAEAALGTIDAVVVSAGAFGTQQALEADDELLHRVLLTNFSATIEFCEEARRRLLARGGGTLCVVSSVAGERARKPVVLYGATKAGLSYYLDGLDLRFRSAGLRVVTVKPGFVRTDMTEGLAEPPFAADAEAVGKRVVSALAGGAREVYAPPIWRWIMLLIRLLPRALLRRTEF